MKTTLILAALCAASLCHAQEAPTWSGAAYYDLKAHDFSAVVLRNLTTFDVTRGFSLDLDAFAGAKQSGSLLAGFSLGKRFDLTIDHKIGAYLGGALAVQNGRPTSAGFVAGLSVRF